ncbi:unnamed protein product, partial [Brenthis ino]
MFRSFFIFVAIVACQANVQVPPPVRCGPLPSAIHTCMGSPKIVKPELTSQCNKDTECEEMTCLFQKSGWIKGGKVEKEAIRAYFDEFAKNHPEWSAAVVNVQSSCLSADLPSQGVFLNCPAYDIMICSYSNFIKNVQPSQWKSSEECKYSRQFAAACPYCPADCFAPLVPIGSCNACLALPRSP